MNKNLKIKICGLTTKEDARMLNENNVDYVGIVLFYPKSKRNLELEKAREVIQVLKPAIQTVAVTVSPTLEQVEQIQQAGFQLLQVHGILKKEVLQYTKLPILRAFNLSKQSVLGKEEQSDKIVGYVFDGKVPGNGEIFDWSLLKDFHREEKMLMLAGGLSAKNVAEGISYLNPDIVDVSSGVEKVHGIGKDEEKIKQFVKAARACKKS